MLYYFNVVAVLPLVNYKLVKPRNVFQIDKRRQIEKKNEKK